MLESLLRHFKKIDIDAMRPSGFTDKEADQIQRCVENVDKKSGWVKIEACPCCGSPENHELFKRFGRTILQCEACTLGYIDSFPRNLGDVIGDDVYLPIQVSNYQTNANYRKIRFGEERVELIKKHLNIRPEDASLLDVGCGTGWFLEIAQRHGFLVEGLEVGERLAAYTRSRLGITVHNESLPDLQNRKYDVITMFDVIEHVPNPEVVLRSIKSKLNNGGICLVYTPNLESFGFHILREKSSLVMPAEHLFYFTKESMSKLADKAGLRIIDCETKGMDIPDIAAYYRDNLKKFEIAEFLIQNLDALQAIIDKSEMANHIRFVFAK